jgi:hypothetical protein
MVTLQARRAARPTVVSGPNLHDPHPHHAITVPETGDEELTRRFAERAGAVDHADGFEGFELLRPTDDRTT